MRAQSTNPMTHLTSRNSFAALLVGLLMTSLVFGVVSQAQAAVPLSILQFTSSPGAFPGAYKLHGYVNDDDPTAVIITFSGAATGTTSPDGTGYYSLEVFGTPGGTVTATATNGLETDTANTTLP